MNWMPIETAPKDKVVLLFRPTGPKWATVCPGMWNDCKYHTKPKPYWEIWYKIGGTIESRLYPPTHWMPIPEPPTT